MVRRISKDAADIIMRAVDEYLDCERFDGLRCADEVVQERRGEYKLWLNIRGRVLQLWMNEDNRGRHFSLGRV